MTISTKTSQCVRLEFFWSISCAVLIAFACAACGPRSPEEQFKLGGEYYEKGEKQRAFEMFHKAAMQGHAVAQTNLGIMFQNGEGVPEDQAKATEWLQKAAEQGDAKAVYVLGFRYFSGEHVKKDSTESAKWLQKAADNGSIDAKFIMGTFYLHGDGVSKDISKAIDYYKESLEKYPDVTMALGHIFLEEGELQNNTEAARWFQMAAQRGNANAQKQLCDMYLSGKWVPAPEQGVAEWFKNIEKDHAPARRALGNMYFKGEGVEKSEATALFWYRKAANGEDLVAERALSKIYKNGIPEEEEKKLSDEDWGLFKARQIADWRLYGQPRIEILSTSDAPKGKVFVALAMYGFYERGFCIVFRRNKEDGKLVTDSQRGLVRCNHPSQIDSAKRQNLFLYDE